MEARAETESDPRVREQRLRLAAELKRRHGCGGGARTKTSEALAQAYAQTFNVPAPAGCPFEGLHAQDSLVGRVCTGLALLEAHLGESSAFPGGMTAADYDGVRVVLSARSRCAELEYGGGDDG